MSENEKGYYIREFSNMTGLPQSKIRYYEKIGLFKVKRMKNGYRWFSPEDAFRVNAFRCLLQYGFSIEEAVRMLDEKQQTEQFEQSLKRQRYTLTHEKQLLSISSYARVIETAQFSFEKPELNPSYVCAIPASEEWRLGTYDRTHVHWMNLGKCIVYHRSLTREESVRKETFALLLDWMTAHGYHMREKMMILPGFLNLDGCGKDMETVILPVI